MTLKRVTEHRKSLLPHAQKAMAQHQAGNGSSNDSSNYILTVSPWRMKERFRRSELRLGFSSSPDSVQDFCLS